MATRTGSVRGSRGGGMGIRLETKGFRNLGRALAQADREIRLAAFRDLGAAVQPALQRAKGAAPRRTGELAGSIRVRRSGGGARGNFRVGIGSTLPQAPVLEFASRGKYASLTSRWGPTPRYLIPSVEGEAPGMIAAVDNAVSRATDRLFNHRFGGSP